MLRGRLHDPGAAPATGEWSEVVVDRSGVRVEQILSGDLPAAVDYDQAHDEWVAVLAGGATLEVGGEPIELTAGDWVLVPAHVPHRLVRTERGTSWLAVHLPAQERGGG